MSEYLLYFSYVKTREKFVCHLAGKEKQMNINLSFSFVLVVIFSVTVVLFSNELNRDFSKKEKETQNLIVKIRKALILLCKKNKQFNSLLQETISRPAIKDSNGSITIWPWVIDARKMTFKVSFKRQFNIVIYIGRFEKIKHNLKAKIISRDEIWWHK